MGEHPDEVHHDVDGRRALLSAAAAMPVGTAGTVGTVGTVKVAMDSDAMSWWEAQRS